ncbi:MAG: tripartite tricarboxylate transporter TctB family protein [Sphaerochaeta sp.]
MEEQKKTTTSDLIMGVLLGIFGVYLMVAALNMKVYNTFLDAPGFFPLILGGIFLVFGVVMVIGSLKAGGVQSTKESFSKHNLLAIALDPQTKRVVILAALMVVYIYGLVGRVHFTLATFLYLFFTFLYLKSTKIHWNILISVIASVLISVVFRYLFVIPLP